MHRPVRRNKIQLCAAAQRHVVANTSQQHGNPRPTHDGRRRAARPLGTVQCGARVLETLLGRLEFCIHSLPLGIIFRSVQLRFRCLMDHHVQLR